MNATMGAATSTPIAGAAHQNQGALPSEYSLSYGSEGNRNLALKIEHGFKDAVNGTIERTLESYAKAYIAVKKFKKAVGDFFSSSDPRDTHSNGEAKFIAEDPGPSSTGGIPIKPAKPNILVTPNNGERKATVLETPAHEHEATTLVTPAHPNGPTTYRYPDQSDLIDSGTMLSEGFDRNKLKGENISVGSVGEAKRQAKKRANIPGYLQPTNRWTVGGDEARRGLEGYIYSDNTGEQGQYWQYETEHGSRVIVVHDQDSKGAHAHAGQPKAGQQTVDFSDPDVRYEPVGGKHHIFIDQKE